MKKRFIDNRSGTLAVMTALAMVPLMLGLGVAVDYQQASNARASVGSLADSATLAGVGDRSVFNTADPQRQQQQITAATKAFFASQVDGNPKLKPLVTSFSVTTSADGKAVKARLCYTAETKALMAILIGRKTIPIAGCSEAVTRMPEYVSIHVLIDASGSMGIGATYADQALMQSRLGCAFACHQDDSGTPTHAPSCNTRDNWSQTTRCAQFIGARTRFDVARDAIATMVDTATSLARFPNQFTFSVSKFSDKVTEVHAASSNMSSVKTAVESMAMDNGHYRTDLRLALRQMVPQVPASGDGSSALSPKVYLVVLTDGVENRRDDTSGPNSTFLPNLPSVSFGASRLQGFDPSGCKQIKQNGVTIMMLNTEYLIPENVYNQYLRGVRTQILPGMKGQMQACASKPDLAVVATAASQIQVASDRLFKEIAMKPELVR